MTAAQWRAARMACGGMVLILAGGATAALAFLEAPGAIASIALLAVWLAGELLRPVRRPARRSVSKVTVASTGKPVPILAGQR